GSGGDRARRGVHPSARLDQLAPPVREPDRGLRRGRAGGAPGCSAGGGEPGMNLLVTGSSGWLGQTLVPRLKRAGHNVIGLDPVPAPTTDIVGSVADRATVRAAIRDHAIQGIVHAGALHKPHVATHDSSQFIAVNVQGTLNLLEEATAPGSTVDRFVFTSTTSLMISRQIREAHRRGVGHAFWIDEEMAPLEP